MSLICKTFANFIPAGLKLNPEKCVFEVKKGKFLGFLVSTKCMKLTRAKSKLSFEWSRQIQKRGLNG
jgi:hypothetical protein